MFGAPGKPVVARADAESSVPICFDYELVRFNQSRSERPVPWYSLSASSRLQDGGGEVARKRETCSENLEEVSLSAGCT